MRRRSVFDSAHRQLVRLALVTTSFTNSWFKGVNCTGKTESVKAFGALLGRLVICFNCDESYSVPAMRRLLRGICATGAFACFDELNRLSEGMLSAVSEMVRQIQLAQQQKLGVVELGHKFAAGVPLKATSAVFITLNPSYAGRSPLPETLKSLFRYDPTWLLKCTTRVVGRLVAQASFHG